MKKYQVEFYHTGVIRYEVMAEDQEQAIEKASELDEQKGDEWMKDLEVNRWNDDIQVYEEYVMVEQKETPVKKLW